MEVVWKWYANGMQMVAPPPYTDMLKLLGGQFAEVAVSQSMHDGNIDAGWRHGIAIAAKLDGLVKPKGDVC